MMLFHGTSHTDPQMVYACKEGFDKKYSQGGMWGEANYFAVNASYSDSYHHLAADGAKQMFYARVMIGNTIKCLPDANLKMPPAINAGNQIDKYDSVQGHTGSSDVFMIYENKQAYPEYLITYK